MVKYPPANAGDMSSIPSPGSSDAAGGATEPLSHNYKPMLYSPCSATREATAIRTLHNAMKSSPHSLQLEKARVQQ